MTVKESDRRIFGAEVSFGDVVAGVRKVFDSNTIYKRTGERISGDGQGVVFYTYVQPNVPLILGTDMYIRVEPAGEQTAVTVTTESQTFIVGDIFGAYAWYIRTFFERLNQVI